MSTSKYLPHTALFLLVLGLVLLRSGQAFYAFFFLPDFHGSWAQALSQGLFDVQGWWAFTKSTPGLIFRGGGLAALLGSAVCWHAVLRSDD
ncbi:MAG: hypothetical protein JKY61_02200 [Planctomycetes bacterium]|nr:hypothetical protein [Planctomycetota bacterium]